MCISHRYLETKKQSSSFTMLFEIFKFEVKYRLKRPETYVFFAALFLYSLIAIEFLFGDLQSSIKANAPFIIARTMGIVSAFFMTVISMVMGVSVLRDFDYNMESLMFINPIKKRDYLAGRFLGSFVVLLGIFSALLIGIIIGDFMPWRDVESLIPFHFWNYLQPFLSIVLPTLFFGSAIFFVTGALSRKLMVVYTQGILFLILYVFTLQLTQNSESQFFASIIDPFSFQTISKLIEFWTPAERNTLIVPMEGVLLYNRLLWVGIGVFALIIGYLRFNFEVVRDKASQKTNIETKSAEQTAEASLNSSIPVPEIYFDSKTILWQLKQHTVFYFKSILKEPSFWVIAACAIATIFINSINLDTTYGVNSYPVTYLIVSELIELSILFFLLIIVFYSGELVWKERDSRLNQIYDALPISDFMNLAGKFLGLILTYIILLSLMIISGILFQTVNGYYHFDFGLYFMEFFVGIFPFLVLLTFVSFFFQAILNHKFISHITVAIFLFVGIGLLNQFGLSHPLYSFGGSFLPTYSDMNGYGHLLKPYFWIKIYWYSFSILMFIIATLFVVRGTETSLKRRLKLFKQKLTKPLVRLGIGSILFFSFSGGYIFYNTNVLNEFSFPSTQEAYQVNYEKTLKKFEHLPQPQIVDVDLNIDLFPDQRDFDVEGTFVLVNKHVSPISEIYIQKPPTGSMKLEFLHFESGSIKNTKFEEFGYFVDVLKTPLQPGDSVKMEFKQTFRTRGFDGESNTSIVMNGTFFNNFYFPTLGYSQLIEIEDNGTRKKHGLAPQERRAKINDPMALKEGLAGNDGEEINFETIISTSSSQIAIAPGYLQNQWKEGDRNFYHYKMDKPIANFYSIVSAEYEVVKDVWKPEINSSDNHVSLEIYYQEGHEYNLNRMMNGMKKSFDYFTKNFSPYQYQQMRIMEFPRYNDFAQSFPNTIPFSEALGFMMNIDDEKDVDMAFYITAHEVSHQWWGLQVNPANVQGKTMISEALAQYSALMVLKKEFSEDKVHQFLSDQMSRYLRGRAEEEEQEQPLYLVESGQQYVYYNKGVVNLNTLQDYISEDSVNTALKRFIRDWDSFSGLGKLKTDRYATSKDLIKYFREVTPDSLQYVIKDLFETITLYENRMVQAKYTKVNEENFKVTIKIDSKKYRMDSLGMENVISMNDWIDIGIYSEAESGKEKLIYLEKHWITDKTKELEIYTNQKPTKTGIDPLNKLIDRKHNNNVVKVIESQ